MRVNFANGEEGLVCDSPVLLMSLTLLPCTPLQVTDACVLCVSASVKGERHVMGWCGDGCHPVSELEGCCTQRGRRLARHLPGPFTFAPLLAGCCG